MRGVCQASRAGSDWLMRRFPEANPHAPVMRHFLFGDRHTCPQCQTSAQREGSESARSTAEGEPSLARSLPSHTKSAAERLATQRTCLAIRHWHSRHLRKRQLPCLGCRECQCWIAKHV